jgi:hypothetical protein
MKKCLTREELLDYLLSPDKYAKMPESLQQHDLVCPHCRRVLNNPTCEETPGDEIRKAEKRTEITVKPGQLWQINVPDASEKIIAITTSELIFDVGMTSVHITPICTTHSEKDTDETDMFLNPDEMPLGLSCLVQWWNNRPILSKQLIIYYGDISAKATKELLKRLGVFVYTGRLSPSAQLFRQIEIDKGKLISAPFFEELATD